MLNSPLKVAKALGAQVVVNTKSQDGRRQAMDFTGQRGVDVAFECAGGEAIATPFAQAVSYARIGGRQDRRQTHDHGSVFADDINEAFETAAAKEETGVSFIALEN